MKAKNLILATIVLALALLIGTGCKNSQSEIVTFGRALEENKYQTASGILELPDSTYLITGTTSLTAEKKNDGYIVKMDSQGYIVAEKVFNKPGDEYYYVTREAVDGGFINLGVIKSPGLETYDIYVTKTDTNLNILWEKSYGNAANQGASDLIRTKDGGYAIIGDTKNQAGDRGYIYLIKIDLSGNVLWEKTFGKEEFDEIGTSIIQTEDEGFLLCGYGGIPALKTILVKTNARGEEVWLKRIGGEVNTWANTMTRADGDHFLIAGMRQIKEGDKTVSYKLYLLKIDLEGKVSWEKLYGIEGMNAVLAHGICQTKDKKYALGGMGRRENEIGTDMILLKVDKNGKEIWKTYHDNQGGEYGNYLLPTTDGGFMLAGYSSKRVERMLNDAKQILYVGNYGYIAKFDDKGQIK